ncbi:MAG: extracellular solute-binding protein [Thermomicrobiaceae bacterium]|nr:extracellular solute-binding protein [Thermomicrobiaceae bacterium]
MAVAPTGAAAGGWPSYYPADYDQIVEASKKEDKLIVYSIMSETNWKPVIDGFTKRYNWIKVETSDLGSYEVFERYYPESASNARTADIIITSAPDAWQQFIQKGELVVYKSPEDPYVPDWTKLAEGIYTVSTDPLVFIWNKQLVKTPPKTMADLAQQVGQNAGDWQGKITTYDAEQVATGFAAFWFWIKKVGDAGWDTLSTIGKTGVKLQSSAGRMVDSTLSGETKVGFFVSTISVFPRFPSAEPVLGWGLIGDGTPILTRAMGITKHAASPNSAKLLVDYILSREGQTAWAKGGLTPYRPDVADQVDFHLNKVIQEIGQDNVLLFTFDPELTDKSKTDAFLAKWKQTMGKK